MKLAASNIACEPEHSLRIYRAMADNGFSGLEAAPGKFFAGDPYGTIKQAKIFAESLKASCGLEICSLQSIWYGQRFRIVESAEARRRLLTQTQHVIELSDNIGCRNIVFGCPRNRAVDKPEDIPIVEDFLLKCADMADWFGIVIALEPNPTIYHTNFVNTTEQALALLKKLNHPALKLNLDFGTVIANHESLDWIREDSAWIHHVHISEPNLVAIREREEHKQLLHLLKESGYDGYVSIETTDAGSITDAIKYVGGLASS